MTLLTNKNCLPQASQPIRKCKSVPESGSARRERSAPGSVRKGCRATAPAAVSCQIGGTPPSPSAPIHDSAVFSGVLFCVFNAIYVSQGAASTGWDAKQAELCSAMSVRGLCKAHWGCPLSASCPQVSVPPLAITHHNLRHLGMWRRGFSSLCTLLHPTRRAYSTYIAPCSRRKLLYFSVGICPLNLMKKGIFLLNCHFEGTFGNCFVTHLENLFVTACSCSTCCWDVTGIGRTDVLACTLVFYFSQWKMQPGRILINQHQSDRHWAGVTLTEPQSARSTARPSAPVPAFAAGGSSLRARAALPAGGWAGVAAWAWRRLISRWAPGWAPRRTSYRWTTSSCRRRSCPAAPRATCPAWLSRWARGPARARGTPSLRWRSAGTTTPGRHRAGQCRAGRGVAARGMLGARGADGGCGERSAPVSIGGIVRGYAWAGPFASVFEVDAKQSESCSNN